jgi:hypothetical protein
VNSVPKKTEPLFWTGLLDFSGLNKIENNPVDPA